MPKISLHELFDDVPDAEDTPTALESRRLVPNSFPLVHNTPYRIAIIGEAPGKDEESAGIPFVGWSGKELDRHLSRFGIARDACFIGNVCQFRPPNNKIAAFKWDGSEIQSGLMQLRHDLTQFKPNVILLLGGAALHAFRNPNVIPKIQRKKKELVFKYPDSISDWRGSFFLSDPHAPLPRVKCIASYHPAACLRNYEWTPMLLLDISRCKREAMRPELLLPQRQLVINLEFSDVIRELEKLSKESIISVDIEGYYNNISCISFAPRRDYSFIVPFTNSRGASYWSIDQEVQLWTKVAEVLASPKSTKVFQNGLYDRFCLQYGYNIVVCGPQEDTMLKSWEIYCELPKSLAFQASIYTGEPYWKDERIQAEQKT